MREIEEAIGLLKKAKCHISPDNICCPNKVKEYVDQALVKLKEPKCKTCGDRREIEVCDNCYPNRTTQIMQQTNTYPKLIRCVICGKGKPKVIPCPDCKAPEQPLAGEFTRLWREELEKMVCSKERIIGGFKEALAHLDRAKDKWDRLDLFNVKTVQKLQKVEARLKAKDELLFAYESVRAPKQLSAGDFTKKFRVLLANRDRTVVVQNAYEACVRIDTSEASRKDLLDACQQFVNDGRAHSSVIDQGITAITKAKRGGG